MKKIFKLLTITAASLCTALAVSSCGNKDPQPTPTPTPTPDPEKDTFTLNKKTMDLVVGATDTLVATGVAEGGTVTFVSDHTDIATVDATGKVTAVAKGTATITATYGTKTATCTVTVTNFVDKFIVSGVDENTNIKNFKIRATNAGGEFRGETSDVIEVGDDNPFIMKPTLHVYDKETLDPADESVWTYDYEYKLQISNEGTYVDTTEDFGIFDGQKCTFDFNESAIGKDFLIMVRPGGLTDEQKAKETFAYKTAKVHVSDGYNVYSADELAYFNDVQFSDYYRQSGHAENINAGWVSFREAHDLNTTYVAPSIFLQTNVTITKDNLPENIFYKTGDAVEKETWIGRMKDSTDVYCHYADGFTLNGNYFDINAENIPLSAIASDDADNLSHSTLFKVAQNNVENVEVTKEIGFKNCSYFGNAPYNTSGDGASGLIFFKINNEIPGVDTEDVKVKVNTTFSNFNVTQAIISFYAEFGQNIFTIKDCNIKNGFSNGLYFYQNGGANLVNCNLSHFGGPAILSITDADATIEGIDIVADENTIFDNWVTGSEPWFTLTKGGVPAAYIPQILSTEPVIRGVSQAYGNEETFVREEGSDKIMNMIALSLGSGYATTFKKASGNTVGIHADSEHASEIISKSTYQTPVFMTDGGEGCYLDTSAGYPNPVPFMFGGVFGGDYFEMLMGPIPDLGYVTVTMELFKA